MKLVSLPFRKNFAKQNSVQNPSDSIDDRVMIVMIMVMLISDYVDNSVDADDNDDVYDYDDVYGSNGVYHSDNDDCCDNEYCCDNVDLLVCLGLLQLR